MLQNPDPPTINILYVAVPTVPKVEKAIDVAAACSYHNNYYCVSEMKKS